MTNIQGRRKRWSSGLVGPLPGSGLKKIKSAAICFSLSLLFVSYRIHAKKWYNSMSPHVKCIYTLSLPPPPPKYLKLVRQKLRDVSTRRSREGQDYGTDVSCVMHNLVPFFKMQNRSIKYTKVRIVCPSLPWKQFLSISP